MFSKLAVALVVVASVAQNAFAASCNRKYTVKAGDTCDSIGAANKASTYQLLTIWNPTVNADCSNLKVGAELCLGYEGEDCSNTYVVKQGDTCTKVATNHLLDPAVFRANNPQVDSQCSNLYIGEVVCVATTVTVPKSTSAPNTHIPSTATAASSKPTTPVANVSGGDDSGDDDDDDNLPFCDELDD